MCLIIRAVHLDLPNAEQNYHVQQLKANNLPSDKSSAGNCGGITNVKSGPFDPHPLSEISGCIACKSRFDQDSLCELVEIASVGR